MSLRLGQAADHGFDQPLGLLSDCHRRIEHFLGIIVSVVAGWTGETPTTSRVDAILRVGLDPRLRRAASRLPTGRGTILKGPVAASVD